MTQQILVRNLEPETVERLKGRARSNRRSLQAEVKVIIEEALAREAAESDFWKMADEMRERLRGTKQTDSAILIREDRDA